jgi:cell division septum initiation protein DivIVA
MMFTPNRGTKQIWGREFTIVRNGLDEAEVSAFLLELIERTAGLQRWAESGQMPEDSTSGQAADGLHENAAPAEQADETVGAASEKAEGIIASARAEAEASRRQANEIVQAALHRAEEIRTSADQEVRSILAEARQKAEAAEQKAQEILGEAEAQVEAIRVVAEEEARRLIADVRRQAQAEAQVLGRQTGEKARESGGPKEREPRHPGHSTQQGFLSLSGCQLVPQWPEEESVVDYTPPAQTASIAVMEETAPTQRAAPDSGVPRTNDAGDLFEGTVELTIVPPISLDRVLRLHKRLRRIPEVKVLGTQGSAGRGMNIRLQLRARTRLLDILKRLPEVSDVSEDRLRAGDRLYLVRKSAAEPEVRKILVATSIQKCVVY